ncbi:lysis system i-spanin subunit Rz [Oceanimonas smirnovii]|uniref:lysis system i-spanin subunit Rz n=1 Tax=Oceanimonas smirnovii TaxID=264574 RepID=UPI00037C877F|nr:lysis system i-spanin subunit Rz [Oceanimonas smirnovii]
MMKALPYVAPAALAALLAWGVEHYRLSAELASVRRDHAEQLLAMEQANAAELARATRKAESLQQQIIQLDEQHTKELSRAQQDNDNLRDAVDAGVKRLRILAKRPASCPVPGTTGDTGLGDGAAVELSAAAGRAYHRLRAGLTSDTAKLQACQTILREISTSKQKGTPEG